LDPIRKSRSLRASRSGADSGQGEMEDNVPQAAPGSGNSAISGGEPAVDFNGTKGLPGKNYELPLSDARIVHHERRVSKNIFSLDHVGPYALSIGKVGESDSQLLKYRTSSDTEWKYKHNFNCLDRGSRVIIEIELEPGAEKYALQLVANRV